MQEKESSAPTDPNVQPVGPHLVTDKTDWIPGADPEPHLRESGQTEYAESYFRCIRCGRERLRLTDFPGECLGSDLA